MAKPSSIPICTHARIHIRRAMGMRVRMEVRGSACMVGIGGAWDVSEHLELTRTCNVHGLSLIHMYLHNTSMGPCGHLCCLGVEVLAPGLCVGVFQRGHVQCHWYSPALQWHAHKARIRDRPRGWGGGGGGRGLWRKIPRHPQSLCYPWLKVMRMGLRSSSIQECLIPRSFKSP